MLRQNLARCKVFTKVAAPFCVGTASGMVAWHAYYSPCQGKKAWEAFQDSRMMQPSFRYGSDRLHIMCPCNPFVITLGQQLTIARLLVHCCTACHPQ